MNTNITSDEINLPQSSENTIQTIFDANTGQSVSDIQIFNIFENMDIISVVQVVG